MKTKKISVTFLIALMFIATFFVISFSPTVSASTSSLQNIDDVCAQMTQSECKDEINLKSYSNAYNELLGRSWSTTLLNNNYTLSLTIDRGLFSNGSMYTINKNDKGHVNLSISGDDNIVKFIPKLLFTQDCEKLYFGDDYGFYINTTTGGEYPTSYVVLFDVVKNIEYNYGFDYKIELLSKVRYAYLTEQTDNITLPNAELVAVQEGCDIVFNGVSNAVVPLICHTQTEFIPGQEEYRVKFDDNCINVCDISFAAGIVNDNSLNTFDENYFALDDYGYFFTSTDCEYNVTTISGDNYVEGGRMLADALLSSAIGTIPYLGNVFAIGDTFVALKNSIETMYSDVDYDVTNESYYFDEFRGFSTPKDQIDAYGEYVRFTSIIVNSSDDTQIVYNAGNYLNAKFAFSHSNEETVSSHLNLQIAMKVNGQVVTSNVVKHQIVELQTKEIKTIAQLKLQNAEVFGALQAQNIDS